MSADSLISIPSQDPGAPWAAMDFSKAPIRWPWFIWIDPHTLMQTADGRGDAKGAHWLGRRARLVEDDVDHRRVQSTLRSTRVPPRPS